MRILVLAMRYKHHVMYLQNLVADFERKGHILYGPYRHDYAHAKTIQTVIKERGAIDAILTIESKKVSRWILPMKDIEIPKGLLMSDYIPYKHQIEFGNEIMDRGGYDVAFVQTLNELRNLGRERPNQNAAYLPMSVDLNYFRDYGRNRDIDVMATWCINEKVYPKREPVQRLIENMSIRSYTGAAHFGEYTTMLNSSKIFVGVGTIFKNIQSRFVEVPACGCLFITDPVEDLEIQGWIDGENIVLWHDHSDLKEKIEYYLAHDEERQRIIDNAKEWVQKRYSNDICIEKITEHLNGSKKTRVSDSDIGAGTTVQTPDIC